MSSVHADIFGSQASAYIDGATVQVHLPEWSGRIEGRAAALEQLAKLEMFITMTKAVIKGAPGHTTEDPIPGGDDDGGDEYDYSDGDHPYDDEYDDVEGQNDIEDSALDIDGQPIRAADVRRMINAFQRTRWALIQTGIELNKRDQMIRRLEVEIGDCGYAPTYSVTPYGYDVLRDMGLQS
jgi:hypothetical protein